LGEFAFRDFGRLFVLVDERFESCFRAEFKVRKFIAELVDPCENVIVLLFVEVDDSFEVVHVAVELEKHFFRVKEIDALLNMLVFRPVALLKVSSELFVLFFGLEVLDGLRKVRLIVVQDLLFDFGDDLRHMEVCSLNP
jgi:hypothetical protein